MSKLNKRTRITQITQITNPISFDYQKYKKRIICVIRVICVLSVILIPSLDFIFCILRISKPESVHEDFLFLSFPYFMFFYLMIPIRRSQTSVPLTLPGISIPASSGGPGVVMSSGLRSSGSVSGICFDSGVTL